MTAGGRTSTLKALLENPYLINPPKLEARDGKKEDDSDWSENFDVTAAFLGPALWSKTLPLLENEFKVDYMNLDEFFSEKEANDRRGYERRSLGSIGSSDDDGSSSTSSNDSCKDRGISNKNESGHNVKNLQEFEKGKSASLKPNQSELCFSPDDIAMASFPGKEFDPSNTRFTDNELKPQPMYKKCKKQLVPNAMKDDRYWARREKNNVAAKRSRDARRIKENQIVMRAAYLEKENHVLKKEMEALRQENQSLLARLQRMDGC